MLPEDKYFQSRDDAAIWQRYCGFLDLSVDEFMEIQEGLLMEQIDLVAGTPLARRIMGGRKPRSLQEFRNTVPLTTYDDYQTYLGDQGDDALQEKPYFWVHTSGRGGNFKWIPYTQAAFSVFARYVIGGLILGSASRQGEVNFRPGTRILFTMAPRPYASGSLFYYLSEYVTLRTIPSMKEVETLEFQDAIQRAFKLGLRSGVDVIAAISSVLVKMGERMAGQTEKMSPSLSMLHPVVLYRLLRGILRAKLQQRKMLPRDLWPAGAVMTGGADTAIYKNELARYWGQVPYEVYAATESLLIAVQNWNRKYMTFLPGSAFFEFVPQSEWLKSREDPSYQPGTVLLNELESGQVYEVIVSHFYGMPLMRYRIGDLVQVMSLDDPDTGVKLPQITFKSRADGLIDLAGMTKLDEKTVWQAIASTGIAIEDWSARKEYENNQPHLRLYVEPREKVEAAHLEHLVDEQLREIDVDYRDLGGLLGLQPVRVTLLSTGTFGRYFEAKRNNGAHLAHLKPPHMNANDNTINMLVGLSEVNG